MDYFRVFHQYHNYSIKTTVLGNVTRKPNVVTITQAVTSAKQPEHGVLQQILDNTHVKL